MSKMSKKIICIFLCMLILSLAVMGCTQKSANEKPSDQTSQTGDKTSEVKGDGTEKQEPLKIKIVNRLNPEVNLENNSMIKEVEKRANVKLEIEAPPIKNYMDRLNIIMASGDLPDIVYEWNLDTSYRNWAKEGLFIPLDDYIPNYSNLTKNITENEWNLARVPDTGKIHAIPRPTAGGDMGFAIRTDWLENLNLKVPTNLDEFLEVAKAFTLQDPDQNGQDDTFGFSLDSLEYQEFIQYAFDIYQYDKLLAIPDVDGQYKIVEKMEGYIPYLTYMRKLYSEKALDQEFFLNKMYESEDKFNMGKIGIVRMHTTGLYRALAATDFNKMTQGFPLPNSKGEVNQYKPTLVWGGWAITSEAKDVEGILKFMDWAFSDEGILLVGLGIEGKHYSKYDLDSRYIERTEEQAKLGTTELSPYMNFSNSLRGQALFPEGVDSVEKSEKYNSQVKNYMDNVNTKAVSLIKLAGINKLKEDYPELVDKKKTMEVKYVTGEITLEQFQEFLEKEYFPKTQEAEKEYSDMMANQ